MQHPRPRTRWQAQRPRAPCARSDLAAPSSVQARRPRGPGLGHCPARPAPPPRPYARCGPRDLAALAGLTSAENRGAACSFPGSSAARASPAARAGLRPLAAAHPRRLPQPSASPALGPQPSARPRRPAGCGLRRCSRTTHSSIGLNAPPPSSTALSHWSVLSKGLGRGRACPGRWREGGAPSL